jgi:hypothetical protein
MLENREPLPFDALADEFVGNAFPLHNINGVMVSGQNKRRSVRLEALHLFVVATNNAFQRLFLGECCV